MWQEKNGVLYREISFKDFNQAFDFMKEVAQESEVRQHHPRWENEWNKVKIWLSTHDAGGKVTDKDYAMAEAIDEILKKHKMDKTVDKKTTTITEVKLYADGGSRGNPGPSAAGFVLFDKDGQILQKNGVYLGVTTNNQAEYQALKAGLEASKTLGARIIDVYMDSLLVINQMKGVFKVKNRDLWPVHESINNLVASFKEVSFTHIPRELNKLADAEVNQTLDAESNKQNESDRI